MAGRNANRNNWGPTFPRTRYEVSGKNREFYTFENAPGLGAYATGGTVIDGGDGYIYHIFTGDGTFQVNRPPAAIDSVDYLIVAGGGGAQPGSYAGGGGGGGLLFGNTGVSNAPGSYLITIGGGGTSGPTATPATNRGNPSTAFGITATGGGGGGRPGPSLAERSGSPGGSGGGGAVGPTTPTPSPGGAGNTPATIPRQGHPGGNNPPSSPLRGGAGGGGAGGPGSAGDGPPRSGGAGGPGRVAPEFPSTIISKAIPAPVRPSWEPLVGPGGYAAGGSGSPIPSTRSTPANSGYGGEPVSIAGRVGGSGIVCVRYKKTAAYQRATGGTIEPNTHPEHPGVWRHIFTEPGTFEVTDPSLQWTDYLAVGGGGGGGGSPGIVYSTPAPLGQGGYATGGGGGAGGFVSSLYTAPSTPTALGYPWNPAVTIGVGGQMPIGVGTYPITIGDGGTSNTSGTDTIIGNPGPSQIIAVGGGAGGRANNTTGRSGGSGGGAGKVYANYNGSAGGSATPLIPSPLMQGNGGGPASGFPTYNTNGSGGGGAGGQGGGSSTPTSALGNGGVGWIGAISPSSYGTPGPAAGFRYFAGGGGGGGGSRPGPSGATPPNTPLSGGGGGYGGGGGGGDSDPGTDGTPGTTNTGGGGGGGGGANPLTTSGGTGGPGIVIIQYPE